MKGIRLLLLLVLVVTVVSGVAGSVSSDCSWSTHVDPYRPWISSVAFHPTIQNTIILSGDDGAGLWYSTDGGTSWTIAQQPTDQSAYQLAFDPTNGARVYAPNHFGRGVIRSDDTGRTYSYTAGTGLPKFGGRNTAIEGTVVLPDGTLVLAQGLDQGGGGLYSSTDGGDTFTKIQSGVFVDSDFRSLASGRIGGIDYLVAGTYLGNIYLSTNGTKGPWTLLVASGAPVVRLVFSRSSLYVGFATSTIARAQPPFGSSTFFTILNNDGAISAGSLFYPLAVVSTSDTDPNTDTLYVGSTVQVATTYNTTRYGVFRITTTGSLTSPTITTTHLTNGIDGASIFDLAVDPFNSQHLLAATLGDGLYASTDGGNSWQRVSNLRVPTATLAFAQDPDNLDHYYMAAVEGVAGTPSLYETTDGGTSWQNRDNTIPVDPPFDCRAITILPTTGTAIMSPQSKVNGYPAIWRKTKQDNTWQAVLDKAIVFDRFYFLPSNASGSVTTTVYAVGGELFNCSAIPCVAGAVTASFFDYGLWRSTNDGQTWTQTSTTNLHLFTDLSFHPDQQTHPNEMIAAAYGEDVYATTDGFTSVFTPLKLSLAAPAPLYVTAVTFLPQDPTVILAATATATLYKADNYSASGVDIRWRQVTVPVNNGPIRYLIPVPVNGAWVIMGSVINADLLTAPNPSEGVFVSEDDGETWAVANAGLFPSTMTWALRVNYGARLTGGTQDKVFLANWGGGVWKWQCSTNSNSAASSLQPPFWASLLF